jgi:hypothetical protein
LIKNDIIYVRINYFFRRLNMNKNKKILGICMLMFVIAVVPVFSDTTLGDLQDIVSNFSGDIAKGMPLNSSIGLNWSDAYIGQFLGIPPRFGFGISSGFTFLDVGSMNDLFGLFGTSVGGRLKMGLPLPGYTLEGRIGGFVLPFDAGVKIGYVDNIPLLNRFGLDLDYLLVGADIRYSLLPKILPLKLSVGVGINHLQGGISKKIPAGLPEFSFVDAADKNYTLKMEDPTVGLLWKTTNYELKAQASMSLIIITPYAGVGVGYAKSESGYRIRTDLTVNGETVTDEIIDIMNGYGVHNISSNGFESLIGDDAWNVRLFGGMSLNLAMIKFDLTGIYSYTTSNLGVTFGVRFQL